jgi:hypothetical protein
MAKAKWGFFIAAAFFAGWALISNGAPLGPVLAGIVAVGAWQLWVARRRSNSHR